MSADLGPSDTEKNATELVALSRDTLAVARQQTLIAREALILTIESDVKRDATVLLAALLSHHNNQFDNEDEMIDVAVSTIMRLHKKVTDGFDAAREKRDGGTEQVAEDSGV